MSGEGAGHITLDRTNLARLADLMAPTGESLASDMPEDMRRAFLAGWEAAIEGIRVVAEQSPHLYGDDGYPADAVTPRPPSSPSAPVRGE